MYNINSFLQHIGGIEPMSKRKKNESTFYMEIKEGDFCLSVKLANDTLDITVDGVEQLANELMTGFDQAAALFSLLANLRPKK